MEETNMIKYQKKAEEEDTEGFIYTPKL